ncbi:MAG: hypothetical protein JO023_12285 [Chloroflexi bacterium]|nr:hypothetical protein [Chloroflexota bacterium]
MVANGRRQPGQSIAGIGTNPVVITLLAVLVLVAQLLDLVSGLRMVLDDGINAELNPLFRLILVSTGPAGAAVVKLSVAVLVVTLLLRLARAGRAQLARNCLLVAIDIGLVGLLSNGSPHTLVRF